MLSKLQVSSVEKARSGQGAANTGTKDRKRFTPWLEYQLNHGDISGLDWIDRVEGIFRIPWVRVDKPEFNLHRDAELFKRWAQHTGKYRIGDQEDPSTWKTRFRCALRKMQEIVEIKNMGNLEGRSPYRIFKFERKPKGYNSPGKRSKRKRRRPSTSSADFNDACIMPEQNMMHDFHSYNLPDDLFGPLPSGQEFDKYFPEQKSEMQFEDAVNTFPGIRSISNTLGLASSIGYWGPESTYLGFQASSTWQGYLAQDAAQSPINNEDPSRFLVP